MCRQSTTRRWYDSHPRPVNSGKGRPPPRQAIATMSTRTVPLAHHQIALGKSFHVISDSVDNADKLVANCHRNRNRFLSPCVPVVNVNVRSADLRFQNAGLVHTISTGFRDTNFSPPQSGLCLGLHDGLHHLLHDWKLSESGTHETKFVKDAA